MMKTLYGKIRGKTIELDEDPGIADGQQVEVQLMIVREPESGGSPVSPGLEAIYAILGERFNSGNPDTAERHNEHQP